MGLDQYLYEVRPNPLDSGAEPGPELAYWRKNWDLQNYLATDNCEYLIVTEELCNQILKNVNSIFRDSDDYYDKLSTIKAFKEAKTLISEGKRIIYYANW